MRRTLWWLLLAAGCTRAQSPPRLVKSAEFGILFGGQIEQRKEIPFDLDRNKQVEGFRVRFGAPLAAPHQVSWRFDLPGTIRDRHGHLHPAHPPRTGRGRAQAGAREYDHELAFNPGDPLGIWNVRVMVDRQIVIDRPFLVFDAQARARELERLKDAGR